RFFAYNAAGGAVWATGFVLAGYLAGDSWRKVEHIAGRASVVLLLLGVLAAAVVFAARWVGRHQERLRTVVATQLDRPPVARLRARYRRHLDLLIPLVLVTGAWYWWRRRTPRPIVLLGAAYGGSDLLSQAIRALTGRARPPASLAVGHFGGHAFPSGHTTEATAVYAMLAVVL